MVSYRDSLRIVDISNKANPVIVGSCQTPNQKAECVAIAGEYAYVSDDDNLQVIDISNKSNPRVVGSCDIHALTDDIVIVGEYAYVVGSSYLQVLDISNKVQPVPMGVCDVFAVALAVSIKGNYAFVVDGEFLWAIDVSDKNNLTVIGKYTNLESPCDVAIQGEYVYVTDWPKNLLKFKIDTTFSPRGNLIAAIGGDINYQSPFWLSAGRLGNQVFNAFYGQEDKVSGNRGYEVSDIYYLNPLSFQDIDNDGILNQLAVDDPTPTKEGENKGLQFAVTQWAAENDLNIGPLYIYLGGHGAEDCFQVMPNEVMTAQELREYIDEFQQGHTDGEGTYHPGTHRDVIVIIEAAASGTFIDDLTGPGITVITSTGDGPSYVKPVSQDQDKLNASSPHSDQQPNVYQSFTTAFMDALTPYLNPIANNSAANNSATTAVSGNQPETVYAVLKRAFCAARSQLVEWVKSGSPFGNQAPQMVLPGSRFTSLHFSLDGKNPLDQDHLLIENDEPIPFTIIGKGFDGKYTPLIGEDMVFFPSDPNAVEIHPIEPEMQKTETSQQNLWWEIVPKKKGLFTLIGYADPNYNSDPNPNHDPGLDLDLDHDRAQGTLSPALLLSARLTVEVSIADRDFPCSKGKMAVIMAGYQGSGDYLWESTNNIANHAYKTLRAMGYAKDDIYYYNPYLLQELDGYSGYDEIRGYPDSRIVNPAIPGSAFERIKECGVSELLLFFTDHGRKDEFCTNPIDTIKTDELVKQLCAIEDRIDPDGKIIFLYDACYSGSFLRTIEHDANIPDTLAKKLITITSTDPNQAAYYLNQGLVSFSYPFFDEWYITHNLTDAFEYAKDFLPHMGQEPCRTDPNRVELWTWDKENTYYVDESRPAIDEVKATRSGGRIEITAKVYSLTGISKVFAVTESSQTPKTNPVNSAGSEITKGDELYLSLSEGYCSAQDPNRCFGGVYTLSTQDPCPYETNYILSIYAVDNSTVPKISSYRTAFGNTIDTKTSAIIITSSCTAGPLPGENNSEYERRCSQIERAEAIVKKKLGDVQGNKVTGASCKVTTVSSLDEFNDIRFQEDDRILFLYLMGQVKPDGHGGDGSNGGEGGNGGNGDIGGEGGNDYRFLFNQNESISPQDLFSKLPRDPNQRVCIVMDAPYAKQFLSSLDPDTWPKNWTAIASTDQGQVFFPLKEQDGSSSGRYYPCFSTFFFSGLLPGATLAQAYNMAKEAVSLTWQRPCLFLPEKVADYKTINQYLGYYLGSSAIPGDDYSLITRCNAQVENITGKPCYHLSFTPHPQAAITRAWSILTASSPLREKSIPVDIDPTKHEASEPCDDKYYRACFFVEGPHRGKTRYRRY